MDGVYREELMEVFRSPKHKGNITDPTASTEEKNPICGDEINLQLKIENDIIKEAKFKGAACAVSVISSEKLLDFIEGKSVKEAKNITQETLLEILDINVSMSRLRCATLVLTALKNAIKNLEQ